MRTRELEHFIREADAFLLDFGFDKAPNVSQPSSCPYSHLISVHEACCRCGGAGVSPRVSLGQYCKLFIVTSSSSSRTYHGLGIRGLPTRNLTER